MTDREQIIEAGARAEYERERAYMSSNGVGMPPWEQVGDNARNYELDMAARYLDAMEPLIRQAVVEELAVAVTACKQCGKPHEYRRISAPNDVCQQWSWADPTDGHTYNPRLTPHEEAAAAVRELGARPLDTTNTKE